MKIKAVAICLLVGSAAMMWGCLAPTPVPTDAIQLDVTDNGKTIQATVGDTMVITLDSNSSTGYRWELADLTQTIVQSSGSTYSAPATGVVGASGSETWTFSARAVGETNLLLEYKRANDTSDPAGTFRVSVVVSEAL